jgi:hypothetical protein
MLLTPLAVVEIILPPQETQSQAHRVHPILEMVETVAVILAAVQVVQE